MKTFQNLCFLAAAAAMPAMVTSQTIYGTLAADDNFSFLKAYIDQAGLKDTLDNANSQLTLFAPNNAAFSALPPKIIGYYSDLANVADLEDILTRHVVEAVVDATAVVGLNDTDVTFLGGETSEILVLDGVVSVDQATVVTADITAQGGIIHEVDRVLGIPDLERVIRNFPGLTNLLATNNITDDQVDQGSDVFDRQVGELTVFLPSIQSLFNLGGDFPGLAAIVQDERWVIHGLSLGAFHAAQGVYLRGDLTDRVITMSNGEQLRLKDEGDKFTAQSVFPDDAPIVDIYADNIFTYQGVVHNVTEVLRPAFLYKSLLDLMQENTPKLYDLVIQTGLELAVDKTFGITVFAPTDDAVQELLDSLGSNVDLDHVEEIIKYHVIGEVAPTVLIPEGESEYETLSAKRKFTVEADDTFTNYKIEGVLNEANVVFSESNQPGLNGIFHVIDTVLTVPAPAPTPPAPGPPVNTQSSAPYLALSSVLGLLVGAVAWLV